MSGASRLDGGGRAVSRPGVESSTPGPSARRRARAASSLGASLALGLLVGPARAAPPSGRDAAREVPIEMTAKGGLSVNLKTQIGLARGDVIVRRDDVTLCCDRAEARFDGDQIRRVECSGRVVIRRADGTIARADLAVFEADADRLVLTGDARVRSTLASLDGERIVYDVARDELTVEGGRSRVRYTPQQKGARAEPERACPLPKGAPPPTGTATTTARPGARRAP
jgi:lipopolysaccharide transport protein LptA